MNPLTGFLSSSISTTLGIGPGDEVVASPYGWHQVAHAVSLAGAKVVQLASALMKNGVPHLGKVLAGIEEWVDRRGHSSLAEIRGTLSQKAISDPGAFERAQYVHLILSQNV